jgi:hypothetical protein
MSIKCTIICGGTYHVYTDVIDELKDINDLIYVELEDVVSVDLSYREGSETTVTVGLKKDVLEQLVFAYAEKRSP